MDMNVIYVALCILAKCLSGAANVSRAPRNIACLSNTKVTITCEASENDPFYNTIDWSHEDRNTSSAQRLVNDTGGNVSSNYLMIKTANGESLVIDSVRLRDAGVYYCIMTNTTGVSKVVGGHLIVLASDPTCHVENVTVNQNAYMRLTCNVTFDGLWTPVMEWTQFGLLGQEKINNDSILVNVTKSQQNISMTVSLQILAKPYHNGISFVCRTYFNRSDLLVKYKANNNTPDYNHTWKSPNISVLYGPINVTIYPVSDTFYPGDTLTCWAMGNPQPEYKWISNETVYTYEGSQIAIVQSMVSDHPFVFSCEARNSVSEHSANITITVRSRYPPIYFAIVTIWLLCTLLLMGILFAIRKCAKDRNERLYAVSHPSEDCNESNIVRDERVGVLNENGYGDYVDLLGIPPRNDARNVNGTRAAEYNVDHTEETDFRYVGADGTQYVRMNLRPDNHASTTTPVVRHSTIQVSNYASIDHTRKVPK